MHARHQPDPNRPPDRLGHAPLINRSQSRLPRVLDPAHVGHVLGHDAEILSHNTTHISKSQDTHLCPRNSVRTYVLTTAYLVMLHRLDAQLIDHIPALPSSPPGTASHLLPLRHLDARQVMWRVDVPDFPAPRDLLAQVRGAVVALHVRQALVLELFAAAGAGFAHGGGREFVGGGALGGRWGGLRLLLGRLGGAGVLEDVGEGGGGGLVLLALDG